MRYESNNPIKSKLTHRQSSNQPKVYNKSLRLIDWFNPPLEKLPHGDDFRVGLKSGRTPRDNTVLFLFETFSSSDWRGIAKYSPNEWFKNCFCPIALRRWCSSKIKDDTTAVAKIRKAQLAAWEGIPLHYSRFRYITSIVGVIRMTGDIYAEWMPVTCNANVSILFPFWNLSIKWNNRRSWKSLMAYEESVQIRRTPVLCRRQKREGAQRASRTRSMVGWCKWGGRPLTILPLSAFMATGHRNRQLRADTE